MNSTTGFLNEKIENHDDDRHAEMSAECDSDQQHICRQNEVHGNAVRDVETTGSLMNAYEGIHTLGSEVCPHFRHEDICNLCRIHTILSSAYDKCVNLIWDTYGVVGSDHLDAVHLWYDWNRSATQLYEGLVELLFVGYAMCLATL